MKLSSWRTRRRALLHKLSLRGLLGPPKKTEKVLTFIPGPFFSSSVRTNLFRTGCPKRTNAHMCPNPQNATHVQPPHMGAPPLCMHVPPARASTPAHVQQGPEDQLAGRTHTRKGAELGRWPACHPRGHCVHLWYTCHWFTITALVDSRLFTDALSCS